MTSAEFSASSPLLPRRNRFAIAALILGILWLFWLGSILALVFGFIALCQITRSEGPQTGRHMAIAGIVLGCVGLLVLIGWLVTLPDANYVPSGPL
jgi:uncharacterized protein DUF4190